MYDALKLFANSSFNVRRAHGYGMRFRLKIVSIHVAKFNFFVSFVTDEDLHGRNVLRIELWLPRVTKLMKTFVVKTVLQVLAMRMLTIINLNSSLLGGRPYYTCHTSLLHEYLFLYSLISLAMYTYIWL